MADHPKKSTALLTEHLAARDNPEGSEPAARTHRVDGRNVWTPDTYETLDSDPDEYRVECEVCGETFGSWGRAAEHAETEHPAERERTSILAYKDEVAVLDRAKRGLESERGEDLALHEALVILAEDYLDDP